MGDAPGAPVPTRVEVAFPPAPAGPALAAMVPERGEWPLAPPARMSGAPIIEPWRALAPGAPPGAILAAVQNVHNSRIPAVLQGLPQGHISRKRFVQPWN